jgi:hypothetical protein
VGGDIKHINKYDEFFQWETLALRSHLKNKDPSEKKAPSTDEGVD